MGKDKLSRISFFGALGVLVGYLAYNLAKATGSATGLTSWIGKYIINEYLTRYGIWVFLILGFSYMFMNLDNMPYNRYWAGETGKKDDSNTKKKKSIDGPEL